MINMKHTAKAFVAVALATGPLVAEAATATGNATVTIQNAFNLTANNPLDFGTIRVSASTGGSASYLIPADGTSGSATADGDSEVTVLTAGTPADFTVDGAAPFTNLTITVPSTTTTLSNGTAPPSAAEFYIPGDFTANGGGWVAYVQTGPNASTAYNPTTPNLQTDTNGEVTFALGAQMGIERAALQPIDAAYATTFNVVVNY